MAKVSIITASGLGALAALDDSFHSAISIAALGLGSLYYTSEAFNSAAKESQDDGIANDINSPNQDL